MTIAIAPVLRYPGGKARLAPWIVDHLPPHDVYIEPYFGGGSVLLTKTPARVEAVNDLDGRVVNFFTVLRDRPDELIRAVALTPFARAEFRQSDELTGDPLEDARRFTVRVWQSFGVKLGGTAGFNRGGSDVSGRRGSVDQWRDIPPRLAAAADRLLGVRIECRPALDVIAQWGQYPGALLYCDPPYLQATRGSDRLYRHELDEAGHASLLDALDRHPGPVVLSGYRCELYDDRLTGWRRVDRTTMAQLGARRTESLWMNEMAAAATKQPVLFGGDA